MQHIVNLTTFASIHIWHHLSFWSCAVVAASGIRSHNSNLPMSLYHETMARWIQAFHHSRTFFCWPQSLCVELILTIFSSLCLAAWRHYKFFLFLQWTCPNSLKGKQKTHFAGFTQFRGHEVHIPCRQYWTCCRGPEQTWYQTLAKRCQKMSNI